MPERGGSLGSPRRPVPLESAVAPATRASDAPQLVMAFDYGLRRIGVACGDTLSRTASPLAGLDARAGEPRWSAVDALIHEWRPALLVVGLPYDVDDSENRMTAAVRSFGARLADRYALQVGFVDERYSSLEASARLRSDRDAGRRKRRVAKADVDATAACVILERWFFDAH